MGKNFPEIMSLVVFIWSMIIYQTSAGLVSFGFRTYVNDWSTTPAKIITSLWYDGNIYQCNLYPTQSGELYLCTSSSWVVFKQCDNDEFKIMIDNSDSGNSVEI